MAWQTGGERLASIGDADTVVALQRDLVRKHRNVGPRVDEMWRRFDREQRETAMRESTGDGIVLKHSRDPGLGKLFHFISEYNLRDITSGPDHFLNMFEFRATTKLSEQVGMVDGPYITDMLDNHGLRPRSSGGPNEFMIFLDGDNYGKAYSSNIPTASLEESAPILFNSGLCFPADRGNLIIVRQGHLLQFLNHLVEEILDLGSTTRVPKAPSKARKTTATVANARSMISLHPTLQKLSLDEILAQSLEQKLTLEEHLDLLRTEPQVLNSGLHSLYYSRPELVPDEKGRILPALTDEYISAALFDVVIGAVRAIAAWNYIVRLLQLLNGLNDKLKRTLILDELANACNLELRRAQTALKRQMCAPSSFASKQFRRISTAQNLGAPRITMKGRPSDWTVANPQLHYILQLCHPDTTTKQAVEYIQKLDDHNARFADDRRRLLEHEATALGDLAVIVGFIQAMSGTLPLNVSRKKAQLFVSRSAELDAELNRLKPTADFGDFVIPMDNLLEPGVATSTLEALNKFVFENMGKKVGLLYQDLVEDSLAELDTSYQHAKTKTEAANKSTYVPLLHSSPPAGKDLSIRSASQKEKRRGIARAYDIIAAPEQPPAQKTARPKQKVKASTATMFTTLFDRSNRGSIAWIDFEAALADLGFSVTPMGGSVYTYYPPKSMAAMPISLHRPHKPLLEGYPMLILARRLSRRYDWDQDTFEVA